MDTQLPHTARIERLLARAAERQAVGDMREALELREQAKRDHNAHLAEELNAAKAGAVINLSDLMGGAESFHLPR